MGSSPDITPDCVHQAVIVLISDVIYYLHAILPVKTLHGAATIHNFMINNAFLFNFTNFHTQSAVLNQHLIS